MRDVEAFQTPFRVLSMSSDMGDRLGVVECNNETAELPANDEFDARATALLEELKRKEEMIQTLMLEEGGRRQASAVTVEEDNETRVIAELAEKAYEDAKLKYITAKRAAHRARKKLERAQATERDILRRQYQAMDVPLAAGLASLRETTSECEQALISYIQTKRSGQEGQDDLVLKKLRKYHLLRRKIEAHLPRTAIDWEQIPAD